MYILSEVNKPYNINSFTAPMGVSHFWTLSGHMLDFKMEEVQYLEEIVGQTVRLKILNAEFEVPASWNILIVDRETYTIDMIPVTQCASFDHDIFLFSPDDMKLNTSKCSIVGYEPTGTCFGPEIPKGSAMIHPIGEDIVHGKKIAYGVVIGPHDLYRWIGGKTIGDIL